MSVILLAALRSQPTVTWLIYFNLNSAKSYSLNIHTVKYLQYMSWIELHNIFNLSWHHSDSNWSQNPQWNLILNVTILDIIHMRPISFGVSHFKEKKIPRESKRVGRYVWHTCDILITLLVHKSNFHYLGYYCSPNLSIHQNSTQEPIWNFLVTLGFGSLFEIVSFW